MKKRFISLTLAIVMACPVFSFTACGREEFAEKSGIVTTVNTENDSHDSPSTTTSSNPLKAEASDVKSDELAKVEAEAEVLRAELAAAEVDNADLTASNEELAKALEAAKKDAETKLAEAQAEVTKLNEANESLIKRLTSYNELKAANEKLQKAYDELVKLQESGWVVIGDKAYCRYEYAVKRTLNQLSDGTWYHQAKAQVKEVILYDDIIIGGNTMVYLDKTVEMARKDWNIAISFDGGNSIYAASIGNYKWSQNAAFQGGVLKTGFKLVETDKNGKFGRQDTIAQYIIGYVANDKAELGVDFYVKAGLYAANPVIKPVDPGCQHGEGCHCGDCEKCPALEPEVITNTVTVIETVTVTETITEECCDCEGPCVPGCECKCCMKPEAPEVPETPEVLETPETPETSEVPEGDNNQPDEEGIGDNNPPVEEVPGDQNGDNNGNTDDTDTEEVPGDQNGDNNGNTDGTDTEEVPGDMGDNNRNEEEESFVVAEEEAPIM